MENTTIESMLQSKSITFQHDDQDRIVVPWPRYFAVVDVGTTAVEAHGVVNIPDGADDAFLHTFTQWWHWQRRWPKVQTPYDGSYHYGKQLILESAMPTFDGGFTDEYVLNWLMLQFSCIKQFADELEVAFIVGMNDPENINEGAADISEDADE